MKKGDVVAMVKSGISEDAIVLAIRKVMKDLMPPGQAAYNRAQSAVS